MEKIIIDTDPAIGIPFKDIDDGIAIALALRSPELLVTGLTLTYGNTSLEGTHRSARRILKAADREDVPVLEGASSPESLGKKTEAAQFIINSLNENPGEISLLTLGPLTNAASAEILSPGILKKARRIVSMGGAVFGPGMIPPYFRTEFNFWNDPRASAIFLNSADDLTLVPCELTLRVAFNFRRLKRLREARKPLPSRIYKDSILWYGFMSAILMRDGFPPHDPLAVGWMLKPELYRTRMVNMKVIETGIFRGETKKDSKGKVVRVATGVDEEVFLDLMVNRLCS